MTGDQWPLSRLFNWCRPTDPRPSFRACFCIDRSIRSTKIPAKKKNAPLSGGEWFFRIFGKCDFEFLSFFFFFFLEMLTPLEKASSMRNAMEKSVYGKRFKSIYPSSDIRPFNSTFNVINLSINLSNNFNLSSMLLS